MSASILREAAALMRSRAEAVSFTSPWRAVPARDGLPAGVVGGQRVIADLDERTDAAEHIAGMHPAVALAVADWLDTAGADIWAHGPLCECGTGCDACDDNLWEPHARDALAVARAYLGREAS